MCVYVRNPCLFTSARRSECNFFTYFFSLVTQPMNSEPIMGAAYHTIHHTHYHYNFGQVLYYIHVLCSSHIHILCSSLLYRHSHTSFTTYFHILQDCVFVLRLFTLTYFHMDKVLHQLVFIHIRNSLITWTFAFIYIHIRLFFPHHIRLFFLSFRWNSPWNSVEFFIPVVVYKCKHCFIFSRVVAGSWVMADGWMAEDALLGQGTYWLYCLW